MARLALLPPAGYATAQFGRAVLLWVLVRALLMVGTRGAVLVLLPPQVVLLAAAVGVLAFIDARAMRETLFYANLGVPPWFSAACGAAVAVSIEALIMVII